ncbi:S-layer homology domain-containing protein [Paenibacillus yonginensis]|nr:S-layer homology domain-containing protein [Paenibacillus yonginensis]
MLVQKRVEFSDVPAGHFAEKAVYDLASRLILQGYQVNEPIAGLSEGADRFEPGQPVTRAEFAQVMVRALGLAGEAPQSSSFADVEPGAWYAAATDLAQQYGILQGYADGTYHPGNVLTRQEAMAIIARSMKLAGVEIKAEAQELDGFADGKLVSAWAQPAAAALVKAGIIAGNGSELQPFDPITRGELAVMIRRRLIQTSLINGDD